MPACSARALRFVQLTHAPLRREDRDFGLGRHNCRRFARQRVEVAELAVPLDESLQAFGERNLRLVAEVARGAGQIRKGSFDIAWLRGALIDDGFLTDGTLEL